MGSQVTTQQSWTFPILISAFLYLFFAYFFLCCSTFAFFLSKFLSFFGFTLPSPFNHLFSFPFFHSYFPFHSFFHDSESNDATYLEHENTTSSRSKNLNNGEFENTVRILELALKEEQASRDLLFCELEQERLAAASAADEAMAMISRLQEEKSAIEIEARQFQRILEEKSAYDNEEMGILKEIIVRREREKLCLEKEVEEYRKMFKSSNENQSNSFVDLSVDPMLILQELSESIDKRKSLEDLNKISCYESTTINELESIIRNDDEEIHQDIQEKGVLSINDVPVSELSFGKVESECFPIGSSSVYGSFGSEIGKDGLLDVENERVRIESEIGWLRERLRAVQEEKERLKSSVGVQEIRRVEPKKAPRQTSLPPLSSKVMSKKRRSRSVN